MVWVIGVVVLAVVVALVAIVLHRRSSPDSPASNSTDATAPAAAPMTGLESALARVTDRTGRPIGDHIDAETQHVDDLRVPDDTGPLLRRALDHVEQRGPRDGVVDAAPGDLD